MIKKVHIENFKCFKDFDIELGPFNVLIGLNDSGKTAFLQAVMITAVAPPNAVLPLGNLADEIGLTMGEVNFWRGISTSPIAIQIQGSKESREPRLDWASLQVKSSDGTSFVSRMEGVEQAPDQGAHLNADWKKQWFAEVIGKAGYYHFDPDALRQPSQQSGDMYKLGSTGLGFPTFLDDILRQDRSAFASLEQQFYERFPNYSKITIDKVPGAGDVAYVVNFHTPYNKRLPAASVSDGVMLSLAYIALRHEPDPPQILLLEEPESRVHHASLKEIVVTLRDLCQNKDVQVIMTTHSPYLLDCVEPEEVRVFAKREDGAVNAVKLSGYPEVDDLKKHFMTGEIWTELDEAEVVAKQGAGG